MSGSPSEQYGPICDINEKIYIIDKELQIQNVGLMKDVIGVHV